MCKAGAGVRVRVRARTRGPPGHGPPWAVTGEFKEKRAAGGPVGPPIERRGRSAVASALELARPG